MPMKSSVQRHETTRNDTEWRVTAGAKQNDCSWDLAMIDVGIRRVWVVNSV